MPENPKLYNKIIESEILKHIDTRRDISILIDDAIEKITQYQNYQKNNQKIPLLTQKEHDALQFSRNIDFVRDCTEDLKVFLQLIFDPCIITPETQLGIYLGKIYNKLDYSSEKRTLMNTVFQQDLRNALSHNDYWYEHNENRVKSITWQDSSTQHTWKQKELSESISKIIIINALVDAIEKQILE